MPHGLVHGCEEELRAHFLHTGPLLYYYLDQQEFCRRVSCVRYPD